MPRSDLPAKLLYLALAIAYPVLCYIHLFVAESKIIAMIVYSPLTFLSLLLWFTLLRMSIEVYKTNAPNAKVI